METGSDDDATKREGQASDRAKPPAKREDALARGTLVGRYVVIDVLGRGGMGIVYAAYDPELDRKVAIKLMQADAGEGSEGDEARLLREAQAMARLQHPNVIAVYDVGTLPGDRVFVAMELVEGKTLRRWLRERERSWREILPVLRAAGAGLSAAHAAGLVHRDFKPDNVLVGDDGRVRVLDFGLARLRATDDDTPPPRESSRSIAAKSPMHASITVEGAVVGTPAYMAPEVLDGKPADARTDQFAFGVALYEALYRTRPFDDSTRGAPKPPPDVGVPSRIQAIVLRALAVERDARFPSMDAMLTALEADPSRARRRAALGAAAVLVLGGATAAVVASARKHAPTCEHIEQRLAGVWDAGAKQALHDHYTQSKRPFAEQAFAGLSTAFDAYAAEWTAAAVDNCTATRVRGEQSEEVHALREECAAERLDELHALVKLVSTGDNAIVDQGDKVAYGLVPVKRCALDAALRGAKLPPSEPKAKVAELRSKLAEGKAQLIVGQYAQAVTSADASRAIATELAYDPFAADALTVRGVGLLGSAKPGEARAAFAEALAAAIRGHSPLFAAHAAVGVASTDTGPTGNADTARLWLVVARAYATQLGTDHELEMQIADTEGNAAGQAGDLKAALAAHEHALAEAIQLYGADGASVWSRELDLAATLIKAGEYAGALPHLERALALREKTAGKDHPEIALVLTDLGVAAAHLGQVDRARDAYTRALAIRERVYGATSPALIVTLNNLGDFLKDHGDPPGAIAAISRARAIAEKVPGPSHPLYHLVETTYAEALLAAGRLDDARPVFARVLDLEEKTKSPVLPATLGSRAQLALLDKDWASAVSFDERAIAGIEASAGKTSGDLVRPLTGLARAQLALGHRDAARPLLDRALAIGAAAKLGDDDLRATRDALAALAAP